MTVDLVELVESRADELSHALGDPEAVEWFPAARPAAGDGEQPAIEQVVDDGRDEQGVALGALVDVSDERGRRSIRRQALREVGGDRRPGEQLQGEEAALLVGAEVLHHVAQRVRPGTTSAGR